MPNAALPLFYRTVVPLDRAQHQAWKCRKTDRFPWVVHENVMPLTVDEFRHAQRHYPIVFSMDEQPVPLALMGLTPGSNPFINGDGVLRADTYMPAYARRYPFILAKLEPGAKDLSLCFDAASEQVGSFDEGQPLFEANEPSATCREILSFCDSFEQAGTRTRAFVDELLKHDLLVEGETQVQSGREGARASYNGFRIVDEARLRKIRGQVHRQWTENGFLPLIYAHLFSLELMSKLAAERREDGELLLRDETID